MSAVEIKKANSIANIEKLNNHFGDIVTIENVPSHQSRNCKLTLNISWDMAEKIALFAAPFLSSIQKSVDCRSDDEKQRDQKLYQSRLRYQQEDYLNRLAIYKAAKAIHKEGLSYCGFKARIYKEKGLDYRDGESFVGCSKSQLRCMYGRIRYWSVSQYSKTGMSNVRIAEHYSVSTAYIASVGRQSREALKQKTYQGSKQCF